MRYKKAQGLSMNVIIIAALALIVLVVLSVIFMGRAAIFRKDSDACQNNGGQCFDAGPGVCEGQYERVLSNPCFDSSGDVNPDQICCVSI